MEEIYENILCKISWLLVSKWIRAPTNWWSNRLKFILLSIQLPLFKHRVPPGMASHTADLYPIKNLWSILKDEVAKKAPVKDIGHLKRIIAKKWTELNNDKVFLKKMISSVPARVEAMVKLEGAQVHKSDYQKISGAGDS